MARTALEDAREGAGAAFQVEADVQVQHMRKRVVRHAPPRSLHKKYAWVFDLDGDMACSDEAEHCIHEEGHK